MANILVFWFLRENYRRHRSRNNIRPRSLLDTPASTGIHRLRSVPGLISPPYSRQKLFHSDALLTKINHHGFVALFVFLLVSKVTNLMLILVFVSVQHWLSLLMAVTVSGLLEAYTAQLDNAFIPLVFYSLLCLWVVDPCRMTPSVVSFWVYPFL